MTYHVYFRALTQPVIVPVVGVTLHTLVWACGLTYILAMGGFLAKSPLFSWGVILLAILIVFLVIQPLEAKKPFAMRLYLLALCVRIPSIGTRRYSGEYHASYGPTRWSGR